jgi:hypothetical protein
MPSNDRNIVSIGPARVKVDDSIYDAVDQGIVGTTNVTTTTTPDTGFTPIGPIGDLITPPVLAPVTGYPITAAAINFSETELSATTPWAILDLSSVGSFTNALVLNFGAGIGIVNLDNPSQRTTYGAGAKAGTTDFVFRDGFITHGLDVFAGGVWTNPTYAFPTGNKTASQVDFETNVQDVTDRYFNVDNYYFAQPHTGSLAPLQLSSAVGFSAGARTLAIANTVLWTESSNGGVVYLRPIDITTGTPGPQIVKGSIFNSDIIWGLSTYSVAGLKQTTVGSNVQYDLTIVDTYGGLTVQPALMTLPDTYVLQTTSPVAGSDIILVSFYDTAGAVEHVYQISTAGYQAVTMPTERVRGLRISTANPSGFIRWWGSDAAGIGDALYEAAL